MIKKTIDINQRIPLDIIEVALKAYINDNYSNEYINEQLSLEFTGENRIKKAVRLVNKIVVRNPLNEWILANKNAVLAALKKREDRNIILISLLNAAFPFSFDAFTILGKCFSVQEIVSRDAVRKSISSIYGSNRATVNAIDSIIPMYIEAGLFERPKSGLYEFVKPITCNFPASQCILIESFKINNAIEQIQDYQMMDPYFSFVKLE